MNKNKQKKLVWLYYIAWAVGLFAITVLLYGIIKILLGK